MIELVVKILGNHLVPQVGVISRRITDKVPESRDLMVAFDGSVRQESLGVIGKRFPQLHGVRCRVMQIERYIGINELPACPKPAPEGVGPVGSSNQVGGDWLTSLKVMGKGGENLGIVHPLLEHLRWSFDKIILEVAAESCPLLLPLKNPVHQVSEFVKERCDFVVLHQSRLTWFST